MTRVKNSIIEAPKVINKAEGDTQALVAQSRAAMEAFYQVTETEAKAYGQLRTALDFKTGPEGDKQFLDYVKSRTISNFNKDQLVIGEPNPAIKTDL